MNINEKEMLQRFSKNLRSLRNKNNYTQMEVALKTGIYESLYRKYESNNPPNIKFINLIKLKTFFNVSLDEFIK